MTTRTRWALGVGCAVSLCACGGTVSNSGSSGGAGSGTAAAGGSVGQGASGGLPGGGAGGDGGSGGTGAGATGNTGGTGGTGTGGGVSQDFAGVWRGYVENYTFDDGTDTVSLSLDATTSGVSGHVRFGDKALLPPPTNPDVGYPPGLDWGGGGAPGSGAVLSGFDYALREGSFDGERLQFHLVDNDVWKGWCALQTPLVDGGTYACVHNWAYSSNGSQCTQTDPQTGKATSIDCGKLVLCETVCSCDAAHCWARDAGGPTFDMQLLPPKADGSVAGLDSSVHNVHLKKQ